MHSSTEISGILCTIGEAFSEPLPETVLVAAFVADLNYDFTPRGQIPGLRDNVLGQATLEVRGPLCSEYRNQAGLGFTRFRVTRENDDLFPHA
jgi:hypothetical protein